jgi:hypothetical protein
VVQGGRTIGKLLNGSELRQTVRALAASPSFIIVAAITLALGLGANMTMFSVLNEVLLRPAPFVRNPRELVTVCRAQQNENCGGWAWADYSDMRDRTTLFSDVAAYRVRRAPVRVGAADNLATVGAWI